MLLESHVPFRISRNARPGTIQEPSTASWHQDRAEQEGEQVVGTNYDWRSKICLTCGHAAEERHIGKSSGGWCFALHVYPEEGIQSLADWMKKWAEDPHGVIRNEYDEIVPTEDMISTITRRSWPVGDDVAPSLKWFEANHAEPGPYGLARHKIDRGRAGEYGSGCIEHGEGTWDLITGEFS